MQTKEQIIRSKKFSPGLIGGEIIKFLKANEKEFYFMHGGQDICVKDNAGKYVKMPISDVIDARMAYITTYGEKEKEDAIQGEYERLVKETVDYAKGVIKKISTHASWLTGNFDDDNDDSDVNTIRKSLYENSTGGLMLEAINYKKAEAESFFNSFPKALETKDSLIKLLENKEYDFIDKCINANNGNILGSFTTANNADLTALTNVLHANNLPKLVEYINDTTKGGLYIKAQINVEKKYCPEF